MRRTSVGDFERRIIAEAGWGRQREFPKRADYGTCRSKARRSTFVRKAVRICLISHAGLLVWYTARHSAVIHCPKSGEALEGDPGNSTNFNVKNSEYGKVRSEKQPYPMLFGTPELQCHSELGDKGLFVSWRWALSIADSRPGPHPQEHRELMQAVIAVAVPMA